MNVKKLIEKGVEIDPPNFNGRTPLLAACRRGYANIVKLLVEYDAKIAEEDNNGKNCLDFAAHNGIMRNLLNTYYNTLALHHQKLTLNLFEFVFLPHRPFRYFQIFSSRIRKKGCEFRRIEGHDGNEFASFCDYEQESE